MITRRDFLTVAAAGGAMLTVGDKLRAAQDGQTSATMRPSGFKRQREKLFDSRHRIGMGGVALGNAFFETPEKQAYETMEAAWQAGIRYWDTSPWYGLGWSERRMGHFLQSQPREEYLLSTKVGRVMHADGNFRHKMWKGQLNFNYKYDYTADGVRRSIEDSLQRLGLSHIDIVFIHDLSPDNEDMKERWLEHFEVARKGAIPALTKMRDEGIIKGWGFGVNRIEPILKTLEVSDPDVFLSATKYCLMEHEEAINDLFPAVEKRGVHLVSGAPLGAGFLAGKDRYLYNGEMPEGFKEKREKMINIAKNHGTDLRTAALHFTLAPKAFASTIPGARSPQQVTENAASAQVRISPDFWKELKAEKLIAANAPEPDYSQW